MTNCVADRCTRKIDLLRFPEPRCSRHVTAGHRKLLVDLERRARKAGVLDRQGGWPYGPNIDVGSRVALVDWAEATGYRIVSEPSDPCLHWLTRETSRCDGIQRRTSSYEHPGYVQTGSGPLDHYTFWRSRDGKPALILGQPYHRPDADWVHWVREEWPIAVEVTDERPWYGYHTYGVLLTPRIDS